MAQPLLARLREKLPGVEIDLLAPEWVAAVARRMPEVREVIAAPFRHGALQLRERWKLGRTLKLRGYDQAIVLPNTRGVSNRTSPASGVRSRASRRVRRSRMGGGSGKSGM